MYEYNFVRCVIHQTPKLGVETEDYRRVINEHAAQGWRLVQILIQVPAAIPKEYELIFERPRAAG